MTALEIVDWRAERIRSTVDGVRLLGIGLVLLLLAGFGTVATHVSAGANTDASQGIDRLPTLLVDILDLAGGFAALAVLIALIVRMLVRGESRLLIESLLAGAVGLAVIALLILALDHAQSSALYGALTFARPDGRTTPFDAFLAAWLTFLTVAHIGAEPLWRRLVGSAITVYLLSVFAAGYFTLLSLATSLALGVAVGVALRYLVGTVNQRPDAARIAVALADRDVPLIRIERVGPDGDHGYRRYRASDMSGRILQLTVMDRDQAANGWIYRSYRTLRLQTEVTSGPLSSMERAAERRILLAIAARDTGAALPQYRASSPVGPDSIVLAYDYVESTPLDRLDPGPTEEQVGQLWKSAERLHAAGISHRHLSPHRITVDGEGHVLLPIMEEGSALVSDLRTTLDRAQLLATSAQVVGPQVAVRVARGALDETELNRVLDVLQPVVLSRETRRWLKTNRSGLEDIRTAALGTDDAPSIQVVQVERFRPRTVLTIVGLMVAAWLLVGQLGSVDVVTVLRSADWWWVPALVAASVLTYFAAAIALIGYVRERIPIVRTTIVQVAAGFVGFVLPPAVGGAGLNVRYLRKRGLSVVAAGTSVATNNIGNALSHVILLTAFAAAAGTSSDTHSPIPGWAFLVVAAVAALVLLALSVPASRRWLLARIVPPLKEVLPRLLDLVSSPVRLLQAVGGAMLLSAGFIAALYFAIHAFHGDMGVVAVGVVYLAGAAVGSAAPTPGGIGAVEAALSAGLVSAGMPGSTAVSAVLLFRIATFWLPVPIGWVALGWLQRREDV